MSGQGQVRRWQNVGGMAAFYSTADQTVRAVIPQLRARSSHARSPRGVTGFRPQSRNSRRSRQGVPVCGGRPKKSAKFEHQTRDAMTTSAQNSRKKK